MLGEPARLLAVVRRTEVDDIERALGEPVAVLAEDQRVALITNRPTDAELSALSAPLPAEAARSGSPAP